MYQTSFRWRTTCPTSLFQKVHVLSNNCKKNMNSFKLSMSTYQTVVHLDVPIQLFIILCNFEQIEHKTCFLWVSQTWCTYGITWSSVENSKLFLCPHKFISTSWLITKWVMVKRVHIFLIHQKSQFDMSSRNKLILSRNMILSAMYHMVCRGLHSKQPKPISQTTNATT